MRKFTSIFVALMMAAAVNAEQVMTVHGNTNDMSVSVFNANSIELSQGKASFDIELEKNQKDTVIPFAEIDSITFNDPVDPSYVQIIYTGMAAKVINPYADKGLNVVVNNGDVSVTSTMEEKNVTFYMTGQATDGSFTITPNKKFNLLLNNLTLTNQDGPAIKILDDKEARITLAEGSSNTLNGAGLVDTNAVLWSKAQVLFTPQLDSLDNLIKGGNEGNGSLLISSKNGHGIYSSDYVRIDAGSLIFSNIEGDGINTKDYFEMNDGSVTMDTVQGDAVDCNDHIFVNGGFLSIKSYSDGAKALKCDSMINILGGTVDITMTGKAAKAIKNDSADVRIENADVNIKMTGDLLVEIVENVEDRSYTTGIKSENSVFIKNSQVTVNLGGNTTGGKGINATMGISITEGSVVNVTADGVKDQDALSGGKVVAMKTDGTLLVSDSDVTVSCANKDATKTVDALYIDGTINGYTAP